MNKQLGTILVIVLGIIKLIYAQQNSWQVTLDGVGSVSYTIESTSGVQSVANYGTGQSCTNCLTVTNANPLSNVFSINFTDSSQGSITSVSGGATANYLLNSVPYGSQLTPIFGDTPLDWVVIGNLDFNYNGTMYECSNVPIAFGNEEAGNEWAFFSNDNGDNLDDYYTLGGLDYPLYPSTNTITCSAGSMSQVFSMKVNDAIGQNWNRTFIISPTNSTIHYAVLFHPGFMSNISWTTLKNNYEFGGLSVTNGSIQSSFAISSGPASQNSDALSLLSSIGLNVADNNDAWSRLEPPELNWSYAVYGTLTFDYSDNFANQNFKQISCNIGIASAIYAVGGAAIDFIFFPNGNVNDDYNNTYNAANVASTTCTYQGDPVQVNIMALPSLGSSGTQQTFVFQPGIP
jgi:hypothetical protein